MHKKFDVIRETNARLEAAAVMATRIKPSAEVTSDSDVVTQMKSLHLLFRKLKIAKLVTAKVGLWYKKVPVVDVIVDFHQDTLWPKNGEEAGEVGALMNTSFRLIRQIMATALPGMNRFAPESGPTMGSWRFQC